MFSKDDNEQEEIKNINQFIKKFEYVEPDSKQFNDFSTHFHCIGCKKNKVATPQSKIYFVSLKDRRKYCRNCIQKIRKDLGILITFRA